MTLAHHLRLAGTVLVLLALAHAAFPRRFDWEHDLAKLSLLNRQIFLVHTFFIAVALTLFGVMSFVLADELSAPTALSRVALGGFAVFWLLRLIVQLFVYDSRLWRGHAFNSLVHVVFTAFWTYLVMIYGAALWIQTSP